MEEAAGGGGVDEKEGVREGLCRWLDGRRLWPVMLMTTN